MLISVNPPPSTSDYNQFKIYRSTTKTGTFSLIVTQVITDLTYFDINGTSTNWYKISYFISSSSTESELSDPIKGQTTTYVTVKKVEAFLQLSPLTDSTTPTVQQVIDSINQAEDDLDDSCISGKSRIFTKKGLKEIKDIERGDSVYTYDMKKLKIVESKVINKFNNGIKKTFELRLQTRNICATKDHRFLVLSKVPNENYDKYIKFKNS